MHYKRKFQGIKFAHTLNPDNFVPFELRIDWIRPYQRCENPGDFCPSGDPFDPQSGMCRGRGSPYPPACVRKPRR